MYICVVNESYESSCEISTIFFPACRFFVGKSSAIVRECINFVLLAFMLVLLGVNQERDAPEFTICPLVYWD